MESESYSAGTETTVTYRTLDAALQRFEDRLQELPGTETEKVALIEGATQALVQPEEHEATIITALTGGRHAPASERVQAEVEVLKRSFLYRQDLLTDSLTTADVAQLLNTSRQTPHDRVKSGTLLAVRDNGTLRFPLWQFDPEGEDGVVNGLPTVIRTLTVSPLAKMSWLTRGNSMLDGEAPLTCLKAGEVDRVISLARAVGVA